MKSSPFLSGDKPLPHFQCDLVMEIASQAPLIESVLDKLPSDCRKDVPQYGPHLLRRLVRRGKDADRGQKYDEHFAELRGELDSQVDSGELVDRHDDYSNHCH